MALKIGHGKTSLKERIVLYGTPGIGKTSFGIGAPKPLFIDLNGGLSDNKVAKVDDEIKSFPRLLEVVNDVAQNKGYGYETLVFEMLDDAEELCTQHILDTVPGKSGKATSMADVGGGYGAGFNILFDRMRGLYAALDACHRAGMRLILTAHSKLENVPAPDSSDYQRFNLKLHAKVAALFIEKADAVLFARNQVIVSKDAFDKKRFKALDQDARIVYTVDRATHVAKNRYGLPETFALSWDDFVKNVNDDKSPLLRETVLARAAELAALGNPGGLKIAEEKIAKGATRTELAQLLNMLNVRIREMADRAGQSQPDDSGADSANPN